ncbi:cold-shock protein [Planotetraspora phitsanulokensis]|uniref:Cold-shock protein n=1 Tax=Planotetraspora phitsanulokensis TaxID=575192 RepID=A0A8J3UDZ7_9ACTN|nr:cold-shock protein [Planotetraspora phitsanulokensis]GII43127.1 cold-shock protein [Planotetraspora phitsanulokensis]
MPSGKVKWYDADKGFGFLTRDDGGEVFVHSSALPKGAEALKPGQRVEFGVAEGRRGQQALSVRVLEQPPTLAKAAKPKGKRKSPDEMVVIVEDLIKLLDDISNSYQRGKHPDVVHAKKVATVLRAVADDIDG